MIELKNWWKMQSIKTTLINFSEKFIKKYQIQLEDIILFGSYMKGKSKPKDIDILLIFKTKIDKKIESEFKKINISNLDLNSTTLEELQTNNFIAKEGLYLEGLSLKTNASLSSNLGFESFAFIKYDLTNIKGSNRVKFYYALNGRNDNKGFLKTIQAKKYSENVIVCSYNELEKLKDFLNSWKIEYQITPALIPERLKNILTKT
ncbi:MAG: nucleotidyltransferase domain-containing protein [Candidatus Woesearchaeota archaeon]